MSKLVKLEWTLQETCQKRKFHLPALAELLFMLARIWVLELLYDAMAIEATKVIISSFNLNPAYNQSFRDEHG